LKKERNCGCGGNNQYPVYPTYPGAMPINQMGMNQGMYPMTGQSMMYNQQILPNQIGMPNNIMMPTSTNTMNNDYSTLVNQVNNLERRVSRLENMLNSNNNMTPKYSESNYYMV